jgi:hypothetical protein
MRYVRIVLVCAYLALVALCVSTAWGARVLWTAALPLLPIGFVLAGFAFWRKACPIAQLAALGAGRPKAPRRVPRWIAMSSFGLPLSLLGAALALRLLAINGDGAALGAFLVAVPLVAFAANRAWGGRSFCNYLCPVGVVERIYTDGRGPAGASSRCDACTGCKKSCPDLDQDRAWRADAASADRRSATFGFPGLVFAFYAYYWLRHGEWDAFFDGRWTAQPISRELVLGPGLFFAPEVPALVAAPATLALGASLSLAALAALERLLLARGLDPMLLRRRLLAIAAFTAFNVFYVFAGAPTLREIPFAPRLVAFVVPVVAAWALAQRWRQAAPASAVPVVPPPRAPRALPLVA